MFATRNLSFKSFDRAGSSDAEVNVTGWVDVRDDPVKKDKCIGEYSDQSLPYLELEA